MQSNCRIMVPRFYTFEGLGQNTLILFIHTFIISCEFSGSISLLIVYLVLTRSWMMTCHYFETYKNTYSDRVVNEDLHQVRY